MSKHPAISKFYSLLIGGIYYSVQCDEVYTDSKGRTIARCHYLNGPGPGSSRYVSIPVDENGVDIRDD